jgi:hypothetical protein
MGNSRNPHTNTKATDARGGHVRLYWEILDSNAWRCLGATDQRAYMALARQLRSTNNGDLSLPITVARHSGITSKTTLAKSLRALVAVGLLAVTRKGGCTKGGQRLPSLYRLTDHHAFENPIKNIEASKPTNGWKEVKSVAMGLALIREAEKLAAENATSKKKNLVQKLTLTGSKNGPVEALTGPKNGPWPHLPSPNNGHGETTKKPRRPAPAKGFENSDDFQESKDHGPENGLLSTVAIPTGELGPLDGMPVASSVPLIPAAHTRIGQLLRRARLTTKPATYHEARARFKTPMDADHELGGD